MSKINPMETLRRAEELCSTITTRINIYDASRQVEDEGKDISNHMHLLDKAAEELDGLIPQLANIRAELNERLTELEETACRVVDHHLARPRGSDHEREKDIS